MANQHVGMCVNCGRDIDKHNGRVDCERCNSPKLCDSCSAITQYCPSCLVLAEEAADNFDDFVDDENDNFDDDDIFDDFDDDPLEDDGDSEDLTQDQINDDFGMSQDDQGNWRYNDELREENESNTREFMERL